MALLGPLQSATGLRLDPPLNHNFLILMAETSSVGSFLKSAAFSIGGDALFGGFSECAGLDMTLEAEKLKEGGRNDGELQFPGQITWTNLTLKRGVSRIFQSGWDWLYDFGQGKVKRMDGLIILMDERHIPHNVWTFKRGFPVKFQGPALKATENVVAIESLEIAHEGLWQLSLAKLGAAAVGLNL